MPQQTIYLVDVHSKKSTKLSYIPPQEETRPIPPRETKEFIVEGVSLKALDTSTNAPDGYEIMMDSNENFFSLLFFFGNNRRHSVSLKKSGRSEIFQVPTQAYGGKFEGWIIP